MFVDAIATAGMSFVASMYATTGHDHLHHQNTGCTCYDISSVDAIATVCIAAAATIPTTATRQLQLLSTLYFKTFCDKFASSFLSSYLALLLRQRRINEMGTQQVRTSHL
jgi:hypothetical protein